MMHATTESVSNAETVEDEDNANILRHASFERRLRSRALDIVSEAEKYMHKHHLQSATDWEKELSDKHADDGVQCANASDLSVVSVDTVVSFDKSCTENTFVMVGKVADIINLGVENSCPHSVGTSPDSAPLETLLVRKVHSTQSDQASAPAICLESRSVGVPARSLVLNNAQPVASQEQQLQLLLVQLRQQQIVPPIYHKLAPHSYTSPMDQPSRYLFGQKQCLQLVSYAFSAFSCVWDDYCYPKYKSYFGSLVSSNQSSQGSGGSREVELELADMQTKNRVEAQHNRMHVGKDD